MPKTLVMKTILVPVDFSETSVNAARYAVKFAAKTGAKIMLMHAFEPPLMYPLNEGMQISEVGLREMQKAELETLAAHLQRENPLVKIEHMLMDGSLTEAVRQFANVIQTFMVIMGITGAGKVKEVLIGSNTLSVARNIELPVLIVPENAQYQDVTDIGLATDFRDVVETIPYDKIMGVLDATGARLHVLNVDFQYAYSSDDTPFQSGLVETMFQAYAPRYHFIEHENIAEGLSEYAEKHGIELLIAIPKKHNLLERLFTGSFTKKLVFHSRLPVLVVHA